jgi:hypothetical protein
MMVSLSQEKIFFIDRVSGSGAFKYPAIPLYG